MLVSLIDGAIDGSYPATALLLSNEVIRRDIVAYSSLVPWARLRNVILAVICLRDTLGSLRGDSTWCHGINSSCLS